MITVGRKVTVTRDFSVHEAQFPKGTQATVTAISECRNMDDNCRRWGCPGHIRLENIKGQVSDGCWGTTRTLELEEVDSSDSTDINPWNI